MYVCWTLDVTSDQIGYLTLVLPDSTRLYIDCDWHMIEYLTGHILYCVLSTLLFIILFMPFLIPVYIFSYLFTCYMHMHFPVYSYTFTRSSDSLNLHIQICSYLLLIRYLERITCVTRSWSLSFLDYRYSCSFIHVIFWFYLYRVQLSFLSFIHLLSLC